MRDHLFSFRVGKLGLLQLACGLENFDWTAVKQIIHETLGDLNFELTVFSLENSPVSTKLLENPHTKDLKKLKPRLSTSNKLRFGSSNNLPLLAHSFKVSTAMFGNFGISSMSSLSTRTSFVDELKTPKLAQLFFNKLHALHYFKTSYIFSTLTGPVRIWV